MEQIHLWKPKKEWLCAAILCARQCWMTLSQTLSLFLSKCIFTLFKNKHYFARLDSAQSCVYLWWWWDFSVLPCVAGCCSVLHCVAVNSKFWYVWWSEDFEKHAQHIAHIARHISYWCIMLQYAAVCCSVLYCVAVWCSWDAFGQMCICGAVCCSVLGREWNSHTHIQIS